MFKRIFIRISIVILCIALITGITVFAHSGRTDSSGGHWNHKTGTYHYHPKPDMISFYLFCLGVAIIIGLVLFLRYTISESISKKEQERLRIQHEKESRIAFENEKKKYTEMYSGKDILQLCGCPEGTYIDSDGLPRTDDEGRYGIYTVYIARSAIRNKGVSYYHHHTHNYKYHLKSNCCGLDLCSSNIVQHTRLEPCMKCAYKHNIDLSWYKNYLEIKAIKKTYDIP